MNEGYFLSPRACHCITFVLICSYVVHGLSGLAGCVMESVSSGKVDFIRMLGFFACTAYGTCALTIKQMKLINEGVIDFVTTELTIILILVYGHLYEPQHWYTYTIGTMIIFYLVQVPNLPNYSWVRVAASTKQMAYLVGFGVYSGVIETYSECVMPASPMFSLIVAFVYQLDISRMMGLLGHLQESRSQLNAIIKAVPSGLIVIKSGGEIALHNTAAERLLECIGPDDLATQLRSLRYVENSQVDELNKEPELFKDILRYIDSDSLLESNFGLTGLKGRSLSWIGNKTTWKGNKACVIVIQDVTAMLQLEQARMESTFKNLMLRYVSHELRTPTNAIQHSVSSVAESPHIPSWAKYKLKVAEISSQQLLMLIDDLLDYSQLIVGQFSLVYSSFNFKEVITTCSDMISLQANLKKIQLVVNIDPLLPEFAYSDAKRLSQVLLNLLTNAIKNTRTGGRVELSAALNEEGYLEVSVSDNGIGIPADSIPSVFNMFARLPSSALTNAQGGRLSLHISNMIVSLLGSHKGIKVNSIVGQGSRFSFTANIFKGEHRLHVTYSNSQGDLNMKTESENVETIIVPMFSSHSKSPPSILVVDDAPFNRLVVRDFLKSEGLNCIEAESGQDCIDIVLQRTSTGCPIKLIIMDFEMPGMDGPTTTRNLIKLLADRGIDPPKVVAHTAYTSHDDQQLCIEAGMVDFIPKPSSKANFISTILPYLENSET